METYLPVLLIVLAACFAVAIVLRLMRLAVTIGVLLIILPAICTVMWGDGTDIVNTCTSLLTPSVASTVQELYQTYREENEKDPVIDYDSLQGLADSWKSGAVSTVEELPEGAGTETQRIFPPDGS